MGGGRGDAARLFFPPCSADHERDWPPCKVGFFGLATNALNVRNNNNNNNTRRTCIRFVFEIYSFVCAELYLSWFWPIQQLVLAT